MDVWTAIITQRAVRDFAERAIPDDALERILEAGRRAPSSKNEQPWEFIVVRDREPLRRDGRRCDFLISLGYPAKPGVLDRPRTKVPRRPLAELVHHERW